MAALKEDLQEIKADNKELKQENSQLDASLDNKNQEIEDM